MYVIEHNFKTSWTTYFKFGTRLCMGNAKRAHNQFSSGGSL